MKMKAIYKLFMFAGLLAVASACFDDPGTDILLDDAAVVEIQEATTATGLDISKSYNRVTDGNRIKDSIRVNLVGPQRGTATNVSFAVDATSTAVAGTHYALITSGTVTIPANSSYGFIFFEVIDDNIAPGESWKLKFNLTGGDGVTISSKYGVFTRTIRTLCAFNRANFIGTYSTAEPGYSGSPYDNVSSADPADANSILINNFWDVGATVKYTFSPTSNAVTIATTTFTANLGAGPEQWTVSANGAATYDACLYSFVVPYKVVRVSSGATVETNTHTFTKK